MTYQGMDPDVVQRIGGDLQRVGADLNRMSGHVDVLVRQIVQHWHGPVSADFAHAWNSLHRAQAMHAADAVAGLGRAAVNNAEEQRRASGQAGSSTGSGIVGHGPGQPGSRTERQDKLQESLDGLGDAFGGAAAGGDLLARLGAFYAVPGIAPAARKLLDKQLLNVTNATRFGDKVALGHKAFKTFSRTSETALGKSPFVGKGVGLLTLVGGASALASGQGSISDVGLTVGGAADLLLRKSPLGSVISGGSQMIEAFTNPSLSPFERVVKGVEGGLDVVGAFCPPVKVAKAAYDFGKFVVGLFH